MSNQLVELYHKQILLGGNKNLIHWAENSVKFITVPS